MVTFVVFRKDLYPFHFLPVEAYLDYVVAVVAVGVP
jgi:hypothetical protein